MSKPTKAALEASKHLTRYLLKTKDYGIYFPSDWDGADDLLVYTDSDWAGDKATRKSKSAAHLVWGGCLVFSYTRRQTVVALSSAEAELYATASGVSEAILLRKVLAFFGYVVGLRAITDSSANNAVSHRLGVGKIRHLETKVLWLQDLVYDGRLVMSWIRGQQNQADLGTKVLQKARIKELCEMAGIGPLAEQGAIRSVSATSLPTNWGHIPVGKLVALASVLSQLPVGRGDSRTGGPEIQKDMLSLEGFLLSVILMMIAVFFFIWGACYLRGRQTQKIPIEFSLYKGPSSSKLHLRKDCRHLARTKEVQEWSMCQTCTEAWLQPKVD
eukprot:s1207_g5.t1